MDFSVIIQRLNELTTFMNNVRTLSKKIFQLPPSTEGVKWVAVYNDTSDETEKLNLTEALEGMYSLTNGITAIGNITRDGADFTFEVGFEWLINGISYANAEITRTINDAGTGNHRIDIAVCDTNNDIYIVEGFEVPLATAVVQPPTSPNTLFICSFLISESVIGDNSTPELVGQNNIPLKIEIESTDLDTNDVAGFVDYVNALNPPLTVLETNSLVQYYLTDTKDVYQFVGIGKGVYGLDNLQITSANVFKFNAGATPDLQTVVTQGGVVISADGLKKVEIDKDNGQIKISTRPTTGDAWVERSRIQGNSFSQSNVDSTLSAELSYDMLTFQNPNTGSNTEYRYDRISNALDDFNNVDSLLPTATDTIFTPQKLALKPILNSEDFTAELGVDYETDQDLTVTDPADQVGSYRVFVANNNVTIGGVAYPKGSRIYRYYDATSWDTIVLATTDDITGGGYTVVSSNQTAVNDTNYTVVANATFTDPSPTEGKGYVVYVRNGTATIGGTGYAVGSLVFRVYHSGAWSTREYKSNLTLDTTPTDGSTNGVESNGVFDALALKLNLNRFVSQTKTSITGVTGESNICSFKIDGGAYASTDGFKFDFTQYKGTTGSTITYRAYIGTTSGARTSQILASAITGANRTGDVTRRYYIDGGNLDCGVPFTTNAQSGLSGFSTVNTPISVNMANDLWITITAQGQTSGETVGILGASITPLK